MTDLEQKLTNDILILVGRLYGEDPASFAPETADVMDRWKPKFTETMRITEDKRRGTA